MQITYTKGNGIVVKGVAFKSFAAACSAYGIPRQQSLRKFRTKTFFEQHQIDMFFEIEKNAVKAKVEKNLHSLKRKFKDKRSSPIRHNGAVFKSRNALANYLGITPSHFKCRLSFLEKLGVPITDDTILACKNPLSKSKFNCPFDYTLVWSSFIEKHAPTLNQTALEQLQNEDTSPLSLNGKQVAKLFNVNYETFKRHLYDTRCLNQPETINHLSSLSCLRRSKGWQTINGKKYFSIFHYMSDNNIKISKDNAIRLLTLSEVTVTVKKHSKMSA